MPQDRAAAAWVEADAIQREIDRDSERLQAAAPGSLEEMETRARLDVSAAFDRDVAFAASQRQGKIDGVQDKAGRAGGADLKMIIAGRNFPRLEDEIAAAEAGTAQFRFADLGRRLDAHEMLSRQSGLGAACADLAQVERRAGDEG